MTEFEWRRQLRGLRSDAEPPARVWTGIVSRIGADAAIPPHAQEQALGERWWHLRWPALAAAAMVAVTFALALLAPSPHSISPRIARVVPAEAPVDARTAIATPATLSAALARNPVLAATDAELRELEEQLQHALALEPESPKLRRMLMRTEGERRRLLQYQSQLG